MYILQNWSLLFYEPFSSLIVTHEHPPLESISWAALISGFSAGFVVLDFVSSSVLIILQPSSAAGIFRNSVSQGHVPSRLHRFLPY